MGLIHGGHLTPLHGSLKHTDGVHLPYDELGPQIP